MKISKNLKMVAIGISAFLIYLFLPELQAVPFQILNIDITKLPLYIKVIYSIVFQLGLMAFIILLFHQELISSWQDLKINHKNYFTSYFKYWFLALGLMMISNGIIMIFTNDLAKNEESVRQLLELSPIYVYFSAVIFAPIVEELVFRLGLRYIVKWDWLFILLSGLAFGGMHVLNSTKWIDLIYIIPYSIPGFVFAYVLVKSKNIFVPMGLHFVHNGILLSIQFIILLFK